MNNALYYNYNVVFIVFIKLNCTRCTLWRDVLINFKYLILYLDVNHDSEISWNEFLAFQVQVKSILRASWALEISQIRNSFDSIDTTGRGKISREEFNKYVTAYFDIR